MKNIRFYLEYDNPKDKRKNHNNGNCVAVFTDMETSVGNLSVFSSLLHIPDSPVCFGEVSREWLRSNCKYISEDLARIIHPQLFKRL